MVILHASVLGDLIRFQIYSFRPTLGNVAIPNSMHPELARLDGLADHQGATCSRRLLDRNARQTGSSHKPLATATPRPHNSTRCVVVSYGPTMATPTNWHVTVSETGATDMSRCARLFGELPRRARVRVASISPNGSQRPSVLLHQYFCTNTFAGGRLCHLFGKIDPASIA